MAPDRSILFIPAQLSGLIVSACFRLIPAPNNDVGHLIPRVCLGVGVSGARSQEKEVGHAHATHGDATAS